MVVSLIFAVLKLDAAPFYILDEFDHALDSQYRSSIANVINELSSKSQFLVTTFKPEMIRAVEAKIFEVKFRAKKSTIVHIDAERALEIVLNSSQVRASQDQSSDNSQQVLMKAESQ